MNLLGYLTLCVGALALFLVIGSFILIMIDTALDASDEQRQARERGKRRD